MKTSIKEMIFNPRKYSWIKRAILIVYLLTAFLLKWHMESILPAIILLFIGIFTGIVYFSARLIFYKNQKSISDGISLVIFIGLLIWAVFTLES